MKKDDGADTGVYSRRSCIWYHDFADEAFREISDYFTNVTIHQHITHLFGRISLVPISLSAILEAVLSLNVRRRDDV